MIFFYKCISIKVTEQIANPIIFLQLTLGFIKIKVNRIENYEGD